MVPEIDSGIVDEDEATWVAERSNRLRAEGLKEWIGMPMPMPMETKRNMGRKRNVGRSIRRKKDPHVGSSDNEAIGVDVIDASCQKGRRTMRQQRVSEHLVVWRRRRFERMKAVSVYRQQEKEGSVRVYRIANEEAR